METLEETLQRGELELMGPDACPICLGFGRYKCVHCEEDGTCPTCEGEGFWDCSRCTATGQCVPYGQLHSVLQDIVLNGYRLQLWNLGVRSNRVNEQNRWQIAYQFAAPNGVIVFEGSDYGCPPDSSPSNHSTLRSLISFLTLRPGDTDDEYFKSYTERQWAFAQGDAEYISQWAHEPEHQEYCTHVDGIRWDCAPDCFVREFEFENWEAAQVQLEQESCAGFRIAEPGDGVSRPTEVPG